MKPLHLISLLCLLNYPLFAQLSQLNDEFDDPSTLSNWLDINEIEQWNAQQLEVHNIDTGTPDHLLMIPHTSSWFQNLRGTLLHKMVNGDFVFTTEVRATNRAQTGIPGGDYSLAGIMMRTPIDYPNGALNDWQEGNENYIFHALGHASETHPTCNGCGSGPHFEIKTTRNSNSVLEVTEAPSNHVQIRMARIDQYIILLAAPLNGDFVVRDRFRRTDFPAQVQVGFVTYTDWGKVSSYNTDTNRRFFQNSNVLQARVSNDPNAGMPPGFNPDLRAEFGFARFNEVTLPPALVGRDLSDPSEVSDTELLDFLGYTSEPVVLALNLLDLKAHQEDKQVKLQWTTGTGTAPEYFELEHRSTGSNFHKIARIPISNKSSYSFVHQATSKGKHYYRLRQVEIDGQSHLSKIVSIKMDHSIAIQLYPNPTNGQLFLETTTTTLGNNLTIINHIGQTIWQGILLQNKMTIDVSTFAKGIYFIQIGNHPVSKIVVQ